MKYYIRRAGTGGRLAVRLSRPFTAEQKAKAELKAWLTEDNRKRKAAGLEPYRMSDFRIVRVERHPFVSGRA